MVLRQASNLRKLRRHAAVKDHHHDIREDGPYVKVQNWRRALQVWNTLAAVIYKPFHDDAEMDIFGMMLPELEENWNMAKQKGMWKSRLQSSQYLLR